VTRSCRRCTTVRRRSGSGLAPATLRRMGGPNGRTPRPPARSGRAPRFSSRRTGPAGVRHPNRVRAQQVQAANPARLKYSNSGARACGSSAGCTSGDARPGTVRSPARSDRGAPAGRSGPGQRVALVSAGAPRRSWRIWRCSRAGRRICRSMGRCRRRGSGCCSRMPRRSPRSPPRTLRPRLDGCELLAIELKAALEGIPGRTLMTAHSFVVTDDQDLSSVARQLGISARQARRVRLDHVAIGRQADDSIAADPDTGRRAVGPRHITPTRCPPPRDGEGSLCSVPASTSWCAQLTDRPHGGVLGQRSGRILLGAR
jgi:hypothetical protein